MLVVVVCDCACVVLLCSVIVVCWFGVVDVFVSVCLSIGVVCGVVDVVAVVVVVVCVCACVCLLFSLV